MYFYDDDFFGVETVPEGICRVWIDNSSLISEAFFDTYFLYHCIRKAKNKPYFEYFKFYSKTGSPPEKVKNIRKIVKVNDANLINMIVGSKFAKIEQDLRNKRNMFVHSRF